MGVWAYNINKDRLFLFFGRIIIIIILYRTRETSRYAQDRNIVATTPRYHQQVDVTAAAAAAVTSTCGARVYT